ncbi:hypothetical protein DXM29_22505 [Agrobacterium tumefaciens]|nr:hypothetical protein DXM29_22505 [Agrobacterium tumefaciens]
MPRICQCLVIGALQMLATGPSMTEEMFCIFFRGARCRQTLRSVAAPFDRRPEKMPANARA